MVNFECNLCGKNINDQVEFGTATLVGYDGDFICHHCNELSKQEYTKRQNKKYEELNNWLDEEVNKINE